MNPYGPLNIFVYVLSVAAFVTEVWALIDAARRPAQSFVTAGKLTKQLWLIILGVASVIGLIGAATFNGALGSVGILQVAAFIAAAVYLADVRPRLRELGSGRGSGPYGPW